MTKVGERVATAGRSAPPGGLVAGVTADGSQRGFGGGFAIASGHTRLTEKFTLGMESADGVLINGLVSRIFRHGHDYCVIVSRKARWVST